VSPVRNQDSLLVSQERGEENQAAGNVDDSEWEMILGEVDLNGDGEISFEEFLEMIFRIFGIERHSVQKNPTFVAVGSLNGGFSVKNHQSSQIPEPPSSMRVNNLAPNTPKE